MLGGPGRAQTFALVSLDLDNFSRVNDIFGRRIGDLALRRLGARLNRLHPVRCFRPGGDNIFMIIPGGGSQDLVRRMLEELAAGWRHDLTAIKPNLQVTFSAGIAYHEHESETATELVASAKAALKRAKREERGAIRFYDSEKDRLNRDSGLLMEDLRAAIGTEALSLHFQPLARQSGAINGFEALIRWHHPVHGRLLPNQFIPLAEESGLIIPLSAWILRTACLEAAGWGNGMRVSVNLSPVQFEHPGLAELVRDILADTGLPPDRLTLEVTEGVLIANYGQAMGILSDISALGVAIALDDFGTGYSSLSYLHEFPLSEIKIDKCFTSALGLSRRSEAIVRSVIELGHALGLRVVVEGVERHDQLLFIESTKCDLVQGFLIGRPLTGADSRKLINADAPAAVAV
jgi:diguanylate cyclase (GGDEF)-like protein